MITKLWALLAFLAVGALTLTACSSNSSSSGSSPSGGLSSSPVPSVVITFSTGAPSGASGNGEAEAVWGSAGQVEIVTYGSSTCPRLPTSVTKTDTNTITVTTVQHDNGGPCTMDLVPTTVTVAVPAGINDQQPVEVVIDGKSSQLAAR